MITPPVSLGTRLAVRFLTATNALLQLAARLAWHRRMPQEPQRVCVWRTGNIGDLVCALPALAAVRRTWPKAELTLLTSPGKRNAPGAQELLQGAQWLDHLWVYYRDELSLLGFAKELRQRDFDLVVRLPQNMSTPWLELRQLVFLRFFARVRYARNFAVGSLRWLGRGPARALSRARGIEHETTRQLRLVGQFAVTAHHAEFPLPLNAELQAEADRVLERFGIQSEALMCMSPGAKRSTNRWPAERFAEIARRWIESGGRVLVLGSEVDQPLGVRIRDLAGLGVTNLCGQSPLLLSAVLLQRAQLLISGDTGSIHLASAVRTPSVSPFSARDVPERWFPYFSEIAPEPSRPIVHRRSPACSPCWLESCPHGNRCLSEITTDQIWMSTQAVRDLRQGPAKRIALAG